MTDEVALGGEQEERKVSLTDPLSQRYFDATVLVDTVRQVRSALANAKINYRMARAGLIEVAPGAKGLHPKQLLEAVYRQQKVLDLLVKTLAELDADEAAVIPVPPLLVSVNVDDVMVPPPPIPDDVA